VVTVSIVVLMMEGVTSRKSRLHNVLWLSVVMTVERMLINISFDHCFILFQLTNTFLESCI
jgi:heme exporter protein D